MPGARSAPTDGSPFNRTVRGVVLNENMERRVNDRACRPPARSIRISGRLHLIDLEPDRVGIRATNGVDWTCRYPNHLEAEIKALLGETVWVQGAGQETGAQRGSLEIEELQAVGKFEQNELFSYERVPLDALRDAQGIMSATGPEAHQLPADVSDEQLDAYLADILGSDD